ncbi:Hypothetical predicted protein [Mytilus galloprovincialis]|uniref:Integrase catalytic domain-containing protein n=1 Tax=Mytilus galloprovincialis TaxID=29158 RepID=A0A8B6BFK8_MYTGA|nr:Hypothetical predicted protein [Mytilus galloprovincialis]
MRDGVVYYKWKTIDGECSSVQLTRKARKLAVHQCTIIRLEHQWTRRGSKYVLVLVDQFSKWTEAYPLADQTAETVAKTVVREFFSRFGIPLEVHTEQGAYRSTPHTSTGLTPNRLMLGREVHLPQELIFGIQEKSNGDYEDYVDRLSSSLQKCHEFARKSLKKSPEHQKRLHDLRKHEHTFETGDLVYAMDTAKKIGKAQSSKLNGKDLMW